MTTVTKKLLVAVTTAFFCIFGTSCGSNGLEAAPPVEPLKFRAIIYENQLIEAESKCFVQHFKEHLYAQEIDQALMETGNWNYAVDGISTLDKIIIEVNSWASADQTNSIIDAIKKGISRGPSQSVLEKERVLVNYEESLIAVDQPLGTRALYGYMDIAQVPVPGPCTTEQFKSATHVGEGWAPGSFKVLQLHGTDNYTTVLESASSPQTRSATLASLAISGPYADGSKKNVGPHGLIVSIDPPMSAVSHALAYQTISETIDSMGIKVGEVRPFGVGSFFVEGSAASISRLDQELGEVVRNDSNQVQMASVDAHNFVCDVPRAYQYSSPEYVREKVYHPYFELWEGDGFCRETFQSDKQPVAASSLNLQMIPLTKRQGTKDVPSGPLQIKLCATQGTPRDDVSIAAFAMRQHLRYDVGTVLNVQFSKIEENCVDANIFSPKEFTAELMNYLALFDGSSVEFLNRLSYARAHFYCSKSNWSACQKWITNRHTGAGSTLNVSFMDPSSETE